MKLWLLVALVAAATTASALTPVNGLQCDCTCDCPDPEAECKVDYIFLMDAASCVRREWEQMRMRLISVARDVDNRYGIGHRARFSVIRYGQNVQVDLDLEDHQSYESIITKVSQLEYLNEGSYLEKGVEQVVNILQREKMNDHKPVVVVMTNGFSHEDNNEAKTVAAIKTINQLVGGRLYFNTLNDIENVPKDCVDCGFNHKLLINKARMSRDQFINVKSALAFSLKNQAAMKSLCPAAGAERDCRNCQCNCLIPNGPQGPQGPKGPPGLQGQPGQPGGPGGPGRDGHCAKDGPLGPNGCNGGDGNPGHWGVPGKDGICGGKGEQGITGRDGPVGRKNTRVGATGDKGPQGERGEPGDDGQDGKPGSPGRKGRQGVKGVVGEQGENGGRGETGDHGKPGQDGQQGVKGKPGKDAADGDVGEAGYPGTQGSAGQRGHDGRPGRQGPRGKDGKDGKRGSEKGVKGLPGKTGPRGQVNRVSDRVIRQKTKEFLDKYLPHIMHDTADGSNKKFCDCDSAANYYSDFLLAVLGK